MILLYNPGGTASYIGWQSSGATAAVITTIAADQMRCFVVREDRQFSVNEGRNFIVLPGADEVINRG